MANPGFNLNFNSKASTDLGQLKQAAKGAQQEVRQLGKEVKQSSAGASAAPQDLINRYKQAEARLEAAQAALKRQKETDESFREELHAAHKAVRLVTNFERASNFITKIASGQATGTDIIRSVIADERLIAGAAKALGASSKTMAAITGQFMPIAHAALIGWELGTVIDEKLHKNDVFEFNLDQQIASGKASAALRNVIEDENDKHPILNFFGGRSQEAIAAIEKMSQSIGDLSAQQIESALNAEDRGGKDDNLGIENGEVFYNTIGQTRADAKLKQDTNKMLSQNLRRELDQAFREGTAAQHFELTPEQKKVIAEKVLADAKTKGRITGEEADEIEKAAKNKKELSPAELFVKHERDLMYLEQFAIRGKRIPAGPTD